MLLLFTLIVEVPIPAASGAPERSIIDTASNATVDPNFTLSPRDIAAIIYYTFIVRLHTNATSFAARAGTSQRIIPT